MTNIYDILGEYYTAEEEEKIDSLISEGNALDARMKKEHGVEFVTFKDSLRNGETILVEGWKDDYFKERERIFSTIRKIDAQVRTRYKEEKKSEGILLDVRRIAEDYEKEDFLHHLELNRKALAKLDTLEKFKIHIDSGVDKEGRTYYSYLRQNTEENYTVCFNYLYENNSELENLLEKEDLLKAIEIFKLRIDTFGYRRPSEESLLQGISYLPILQGKATNALAIIATRSAQIEKDSISHSGRIRVGKEGEEVIGIIKDDKLISKLGVGAHKMLVTAISIFTANNHTGERARQLKNTEVVIPLKEYAKKKGYKVDAQLTITPEEEKKEAQRVKNELKNARRAIEKDLEVLYNFSFQWSEKIRGKEENLGERRIIDEYAIEDGYIKINIAKSFSDYLIRLPISQYPVALLSLAETQKNAYSIGFFMSLHANNDNNIRGGTSDLLKVKTLLSYTNLPSIDEVKAKRKSWTERIKEPLERALDQLGASGCNLLEDWEYTHSKGVPLTDEEASSLIDDYYIWEETLVKFSLKDLPDHRDRIEAKAQRNEEAKTKKTAKRKQTDSKK